MEMKNEYELARMEVEKNDMYVILEELPHCLCGLCKKKCMHTAKFGSDVPLNEKCELAKIVKKYRLKLGMSVGEAKDNRLKLGMWKEE